MIILNYYSELLSGNKISANMRKSKILCKKLDMISKFIIWLQVCLWLDIILIFACSTFFWGLMNHSFRLGRYILSSIWIPFYSGNSAILILPRRGKFSSWAGDGGALLPRPLPRPLRLPGGGPRGRRQILQGKENPYHPIDFHILLQMG